MKIKEKVEKTISVSDCKNLETQGVNDNFCIHIESTQSNIDKDSTIRLSFYSDRAGSSSILQLFSLSIKNIHDIKLVINSVIDEFTKKFNS